MEGGEAEGGAGQLQQGVLTVGEGAQDTQLTLRDTGQQGEVEGERGSSHDGTSASFYCLLCV